jgi:hypothetical protein
LIELSPVLKAMGVGPEIGIGAIRFSLGRTTVRGVDFLVSGCSWPTPWTKGSSVMPRRTNNAPTPFGA